MSDIGSPLRPLLLALLAAACTPDSSREPASDSAGAGAESVAATDSQASAQGPVFYSRSRMLDVTNDQRPDSIHLVATGERTDSLQIGLTIHVDGVERHREGWGSSYELALVHSSDRRGLQADEILRAKLDSVLASVVVQPFDAGVRVMAEDSIILAGLDPRPAHRVSLSYGYESTTRLVWDARRARFVRLWSCC